MVNSLTFSDQLDAQIQSKNMLKHTFYQAWSRGELSKECLQEYSKEYYHHVKAFPQYISALHSHTECAETRRVLLQNLVEEEAGSPNHPELWNAFACSLGVKQEDLLSHEASSSMKTLVEEFRHICGNLSTAEGVAALYAYESQIPEICVSKISGLKEHYGMKDPKQWEYFHIHIEADKEHAAQERQLLDQYVTSENYDKVFQSVDKVLDNLCNFLSSLCEKYNICPTCH